MGAMIGLADIVVVVLVDFDGAIHPGDEFVPMGNGHSPFANGQPLIWVPKMSFPLQFPTGVPDVLALLGLLSNSILPATLSISASHFGVSALRLKSLLDPCRPKFSNAIFASNGLTFKSAGSTTDVLLLSAGFFGAW